MSARYRAWQFFRAASVWVGFTPVQDHLAASHLPADALQLFLEMPRHDRHHALSVLQTLQGDGLREPDLMAAALLHDVGKSASVGGRVRVWHRVVFVLVQRLRPSLMEHATKHEHQSWRRPFHVQVHHAEVGAKLARSVGCSESTVDLILRHEEPPSENEGPLLRALRAADGKN
jgi:putative nucleotidyltransferase with HDIG domain